MKVAFTVCGVVLTVASLCLPSFQTNAETIKYVVKDDAIAKSLTGKPGDPVAGLKTVINRKLGHCVSCHKMPIPDQSFQGDVAPNLAGVGSRYTAGELRLRIVDPKKINPDTFMPAYYRTKGLHRVQKPWRGKTILSAQQVEDVIAYLMTLRETK